MRSPAPDHLHQPVVQPHRHCAEAQWEPATVYDFLGLAGYYRRFVANLSSIASTLSDPTQKEQPDRVCCTNVVERTFKELKKALTSSPVLQNPDFYLPFIIHMDASETIFGRCCLSSLRIAQLRRWMTRVNGFSSLTTACLWVTPLRCHFTEARATS
ncbi:uncharacterized protein LOC124627066 [Tachysurus ichikawai]